MLLFSVCTLCFCLVLTTAWTEDWTRGAGRSVECWLGHRLFEKRTGSGQTGTKSFRAFFAKFCLSPQSGEHGVDALSTSGLRAVGAWCLQRSRRRRCLSAPGRGGSGAELFLASDLE